MFSRVSRTLFLRTQVQAPYLYRSFTQSGRVNLKRDLDKGKTLFTPSRDQEKVAKLCENRNVLVRACPGSGKTATIEAIAAKYPDKRIVAFTYGRTPADSMKDRLEKYPNCHVSTIHGIAGQLSNSVKRTDIDLADWREQVRKSGELPQWKSEPFDIVVLDEFQDCNDLLLWTISCFIQANNRKLRLKRPGDEQQSARIVTLGDAMQGIFRFHGSDSRYLTMALEIFSLITPHASSNVELGRSFRMPATHVQFVVRLFLEGAPYITSLKPGPEPLFLRYNTFESGKLMKELYDLIKFYGAQNSVVIAPSTRNNVPLKKSINALSKRRVPIAEPRGDELPVDKRTTNGKLRVSTIHAFKGSEADLVILFDVDNSFLEFFGRHLADDRCPNEIFVALTRAKVQLVLVHDDNQKLMPFMSVTELYKTATVKNMTKNGPIITAPDQPGRLIRSGFHQPPRVFVRELTRHLPAVRLREIIRQELCIRELSPSLPKNEHINMCDIVCTNRAKQHYEAVSDINGLVVAAAVEHELTGTVNKTLGLNTDMGDGFKNWSKDGIAHLCQLACQYVARESGYTPRWRQMRYHPFDWINSNDMIRVRTRIRDVMASEVMGQVDFEVKSSRLLSVEDQKTKLVGCADIIISSQNGRDTKRNPDSIWEIKFVSSLSDEHISQAALYAYLFSAHIGKLPRIILFNVRDGHKLAITVRHGEVGLRRMVESILRLKYTTNEDMSDEEFLAKCRETIGEVLNLK